jgi:hypothetical protein
MAEISPLDQKILDLTERYLEALASFEENGTPETYEVRWKAEVALNNAVVQKRQNRPGASIVIEEN